jgi:hypothetical protein
MLMYECLSLNHPFSRNKRDHARELILHGWRPSLTEQVIILKTILENFDWFYLLGIIISNFNT